MDPGYHVDESDGFSPGFFGLPKPQKKEMDVSENRGTPKSSISIEFSIINHSALGYPYFWKHPYV